MALEYYCGGVFVSRSCGLAHNDIAHLVGLGLYIVLFSELKQIFAYLSFLLRGTGNFGYLIEYGPDDP